MKILISGASGYLGSHLVKLLAKKHQVIALIRSSSSKERIKNLPIEIVYLDEEGALEKVFQGFKPNLVINTSALYGRKGEAMSALIEANIGFPNKLLTLANQYGIEAFINTGTSLPDSVSPYSLTKNTFVKLAGFNKVNTLKFINVALEHFYGSDDDPSKFTTYVINSCLKGEGLQLTSGEQERDFIYIHDVVSAFGVIVDKIENFENFETVEIGSGSVSTVRELVEMIHACSNSTSILEFGVVAKRTNELMYSCANVTKLKELGWVRKYSLKEGIEATLISEEKLKVN